MSNQYRDFGQLYRAAFAEQDPNKKSQLLTAVQKVIAEWEALPSGETLPHRFTAQLQPSLPVNRQLA
ncbi:MAG TPA: hypothetical protein VFA89_03445 [Terriglobales bacterium]|nr:hypothetical protein [Terriglobales bacterium]